MPRSLAFLLTLLTLLAACSGVKPELRPGSLAILPFENQTGDASLDWAARAVQTLLVTQTGARVTARDWNDAHQPGIEAVLSASIRREGKELQIDAVAHSIADHKAFFTTRVSSTGGADELTAMTNDLAHRITPQVRLTGLRDPASLRAAGELFDSNGIDQLSARCTSFLEAEPAFSPAYEACVSELGAGGRIVEVQKVLALASGRENELTFGARTAIANAQFQLGNLKEAAAYYRSLTGVEPKSWNQLIYSEGLMGNLEAASQAFAEYVKAAPAEEPNAIDSLAEVLYFTGRYGEAEKQFLGGVKKFPGFQDGVGNLKAAASRLVAGDAKAADAIAVEYFDTLRRKENRALPAMQGVWKQLTAASAAGGPKAAAEAVDKFLMRRPAPTPPPS